MTAFCTPCGPTAAAMAFAVWTRAGGISPVMIYAASPIEASSSPNRSALGTLGVQRVR